MLTMLLVVSLMTIAALAALPDMIFELKRDQEKEMIHRGVQYSRAIRIYYRKFGRYPTSLNDLDNTNNLRYLRKHYKDPLTGKDFKLLRFGEPGLQLGGSFGGGTIPGATPAGAMNGPASGSSFGNSFGSSNGSSFGGSSFGNSFGGSSFGNSGSSFGNNGVNSSGVFSQTSASGGTSNSGFGSNSNSQTSSSQSTDSSSGSSSTDASANGQKDESPGEQQLVASGPIVGVASLSKKKTIRIYNHKTKYNEWQFIYDPTADRGGLITTPYQSPLQGFGGQSLQPAQNSSQSGNSSSFGNSFGQSSGFGGSSFGGSSFGQSSGFGNSSNSGGSNSSNPPQQP
jgi:type II secretory pathway pseudopilin PulG